MAKKTILARIYNSVDLFTWEEFDYPKTDSTKIVFRYTKRGYSRSEFSPEQLKGQIQVKEIDRVLDTLSNHKLIKPSRPLWWLILIFSYALLGTFLIIFGFGYIVIESRKGKNPITDNEEKLINLALASVFLGIMGYLFYLYYLEAMKYTDQRTEVFEDWIRLINRQEFKRKGVSWSVGTKTMWIQLNLSIKFQFLRSPPSDAESVLDKTLGVSEEREAEEAPSMVGVGYDGLEAALLDAGSSPNSSLRLP